MLLTKFGVVLVWFYWVKTCNGMKWFGNVEYHLQMIHLYPSNRYIREPIIIYKFGTCQCTKHYFIIIIIISPIRDFYCLRFCEPFQPAPSSNLASEKQWLLLASGVITWGSIFHRTWPLPAYESILQQWEIIWPMNKINYYRETIHVIRNASLLTHLVPGLG